jgi:hypothetical protein
MVGTHVARVYSIFLGLAFVATSLSAKSATVQDGASHDLIAHVLRLNPENRKELLDFDDWVDTALGTPAIDKRTHRGLKELKRLAKELRACGGPAQAAELSRAWRETAASLANLERSPVPEKVDFFETPWLFMNRLNRPVGRGRTVATDLALNNQADSSRIDPAPSTFWHRPLDVSSENLYYAFGRTNLLLPDRTLCAYAGPKESFGRNPGFDIDFQGVALKLKFAEVSSEPFAARIFSALGYFTDPTDYASSVKLVYSRAMLQEFNSRKPLSTHFTFLGFLPVFTLRLQQHYDPFNYIERAVLTNGVVWSGAQLKSHLFLSPSRSRPEADPSNFNPSVEATIAYVETVPANVQIKVGKSIGPWDFGQLDHASRRELRGAALLAGWLGWFDTRFDNTRLRVIKLHGHSELRHVFSDLGGVLGKTRGLLYARGELPNAFPWSFTRAFPDTKDSNQPAPFPLPGYEPLARTPAFAEMTVQDARWMARLIGALTEEQIRQALVASGFNSVQTRLYLEKLISRRDQMIVDLGLESEIPLLRAPNTIRRFSYDPLVEGPIVVRVVGNPIEAPTGNERIVAGKIIKRH